MIGCVVNEASATRAQNALMTFGSQDPNVIALVSVLFTVISFSGFKEGQVAIETFDIVFSA